MNTLIKSLLFWLSLLVFSQAATPTRLACVGDSITEGLGVANRSQDSYPAELGRLLGPEWEVKNFGVSGATLLKTGDKPYDRQKAYQAALDYQPDVVVIALGTNDTKPQNIEAHPDDFLPSYQALIASFRQKNPQVKIYVCLPVPVFPENWGIRETVLVEKILPLIRTAAADAKVPVIDLHTPLMGKNRCFSDRVHPNEEGARLIARAVYQGITGSVPPPQWKPPVGLKILPLGDSITVGATDFDQTGPLSGYRDRLAELLMAEKVTFTFLGSDTRNSSLFLRNAGQMNHEGHGSYKMDDILANLDAFRTGPSNTSNDGYWITGGHNTDRQPLDPDIVLLLAGTNDVQAKASLETMQQRMTGILDWFQKNRPRAQVFVGTVVPYDDVLKKTDNYHGKVKEFNAWMMSTFPKKYPQNVHLVDLYSPYMDALGNLKTKDSPDGIFLKDGVHPSHNGYRAIGEAWFAAIKAQYKKRK